MESFSYVDIVSIAQDDGPNPVVSIQYDHQSLMGKFRAVMRAGERSPRVLAITTAVLEENPANYTVWQYRRDCLEATGSDLNVELDYMDQFSSDNPKNYQIWYHRRAIVERLGSGCRELAFCDSVLQIDAKNYHCWAHRQWAIATFGLWEGELENTERLLTADVRNNSVWNQRWFVVHRGPIPVTNVVVNREVSFAFEHISLVQQNESAWNYLRGLVEQHADLGCVNRVKEWCEALVSAGRGHRETTGVSERGSEKGGTVENVYALSLLGDICEREGTDGSREEAGRLFERLMVADEIRVKAWSRRKERVLARVGAM